MAPRLGGVMDGKVISVRGQITVVCSEIPAMIDSLGSDDAPNEVTYLMMCPAGALYLFLSVCAVDTYSWLGGGTEIGGSYQKRNWDTTPDPNMTQRILKRAIEVCLQLVKP